MDTQDHYESKRLSLKNQLCTVRYIGPVSNRPGTWLGVEWDDPNRGKHSGIHEGTTYFICRSKSPTAASFLRPNQPWDAPRTLLQALREKYMPKFRKDEAAIVYISGKQAEEIGFEKFSQRQTKLQGIHVLVLDNMRVWHSMPDQAEAQLIQEYCVEISELDLTSNLFETFDEIVELCALLPKLRGLTLSGNRFAVDIGSDYSRLSGVTSLSLSRTMLSFAEINKILTSFPSLKSLTMAHNEIKDSIQLTLPRDLLTLDMSDNLLSSLSSLQDPGMEYPPTIILKRNRISTVTTAARTPLTLSVVELDLTYNAIDNWNFFNSITNTAFPRLKHLRVTGNPLYKDLVSAEGKPLTTEDGYMLTIARLPQLDFLNYAKITEKERLNAETYYLNQIAIEISRAPQERASEIISEHPRYSELCEEYGEPTLQRQPRQDEINPNSLAAKLVTVMFTLGSGVLPNNRQRTWMDEIPKSFSIYALLGIVGKHLGVMPLDLRLVLETNEQDPIGLDGGYNGPEWWDSSDDEIEDQKPAWVRREVELVAGTRTLGTYVEGRKASIRVEIKHVDK